MCSNGERLVRVVFRVWLLSSVLVACLCAAGCGPSIEIGSSSGGDTSTTTTGTSASGGGAGGSGASGGDPSTGGSVGCTTISDCVPPGDPGCASAAGCIEGVCSFDLLPQGTALPDPTPGDCATLVCDGAGGVEPAPLDTDVSDDGNPCTLDACQAMTTVHTPLSAAPCYTGPPGTEGVGICAAGTQQCGPDGQPTGACEGEVLPGAEMCDLAALDEDCDGQGNEQDVGCCGDGVVEAGEACDDGNADPTDACTPACAPPACGDGYVQPALGEECDDGNTSDGDPCSLACKEQRVLLVDAGNLFTCALLSDHRVKCWGWAGVGELGLGNTLPHGPLPNTMGSHLPAVNLGTGRTAVGLSVGGNHACAVLDDGALKCWGANAYGQLGLGDTEARGDEPGEMGDDLPAVDLGAGRTAIGVAAAYSSTCALLDDGTVKCWGYNLGGQLGLGDTLRRGDEPGEMGDNLPVVDLGTGMTPIALVAGHAHVCALFAGGSVKCWGSNAHGALGLGDTLSRGDNPNEMGNNLPFVNLAGAVVTSIAAGSTHTCALLAGGLLKCWGDNTTGMLGLEDVESRGDDPFEMANNLPVVNVGSGKLVVSVTASEYHTCAALSDETVRCWGVGSYGRLGNESTEGLGYAPGDMGDNLPPVDLGTDKHVVSVASTVAHTCVVLTTGAVQCWGDNGEGQCGFKDPSIAGSQAGTMGDALPPTLLFSDQW